MACSMQNCRTLFEKAPRPTDCTTSSIHDCPLVSPSPSILEPKEFYVDFILESYSTDYFGGQEEKDRRVCCLDGRDH